MDQKRPMRRWFPVIAAPLLAACGRPEAGEREDPAADERIACATGGAAQLQRLCRVERQAGPGGTLLVIRSPSGSFRRLRLRGEGAIEAADGAAPAVVTPLAGNRIQVAIEGDRYILPKAGG